MPSLPDKWAAAFAAAVGAGGWVVVSHLSHRREAWDSGIYFSAFFPALLVGTALLGFLAPERAWRWGFVPFGAQALVAFVQDPTANLLPIGLVVLALFGAIAAVPARLGAWLRRGLERRVA